MRASTETTREVKNEVPTDDSPDNPLLAAGWPVMAKKARDCILKLRTYKWILDDLDRLAAAAGRSRSNYVEELLKEHIHQESKKEQTEEDLLFYSKK